MAGVALPTSVGGQPVVTVLGRVSAVLQTPNAGLLIASQDSSGVSSLLAVSVAGALRVIAGGLPGALVTSGEAATIPFYGSTLVLDPTDGSVWFPALCTVQSIDTSGFLTTPVAVGNVCDFAGDGGPSVLARVNSPVALAFAPFDSSLFGTLFI